MFTEHKYHAIELTVTAIMRGYRKIIAVGGDGTLHEVVNGLFIQREVPTTEITVAVISLGTGNDWGRTYGFPQDYRGAVQAIVAGRTFLQDVGRISYLESCYGQSRYIANVAGLGFDSVVIREYDKLKAEGRTGKPLYMWSLLKALMRYRSGAMKVWLDDKLIADEKIFSIAVGIGKYNGAGMMQLPHAVSDDGMLDLTIIRRISKLGVMSKIKTLYNGTIYDVRQASHNRGCKIRVETGPETLVEADGELLGNSPFEFSIVEKALRVIVSENFRTETIDE